MKLPIYYPPTLTEEETIERVVSGEFRGLARFGDGDFNFLRGQRDRFYKYDPHLAENLGDALVRGTPGVLNCLIPGPGAENYSAVPGTPGMHRWLSYLEANAGILSLVPRVLYGSSNVSRMDSCPWLHNRAWWLRVARLWQGKDVALIAGSDRSLTTAMLLGSPAAPESVRTPVIPKAADAQDDYARIMWAALKDPAEIFIICAGLIARPLVHDLVAAGRRAYDLGHLGLWFRNGDPIPLAECRR